MNFNQIIYLTLFILIVSCSNEKEENDTPNGLFSKDEAQDLAKILNSSDTISSNVVDEITIGHKLSYSDSIWKLIDQDILNCNNPIINEYNAKKWSYCRQGNEFEVYKIEYTENNIAFTEQFLTKNDQLLYAVEWEKRTADMSDNEATYWNCEYIIQNNQVVDHISLGMGKTEDESFNPEDIIKLWNSRKPEFLKFKN